MAKKAQKRPQRPQRKNIDEVAGALYLAVHSQKAARLIVVLGTSHRLQGAVNSRWQNIDDPSYRRLVEQLISSHRVEVIFEEASGCGPTEAQKIAGLAQICYMDVDPSPDERVRLGMRPKP